MFANGLQPWHIIVLVIVLIALFGAKRLPGAARGIGQSMRIFKAEAKQMREGDDGESKTGHAEAAAPAEHPAPAEHAAPAEDPVKRQLQEAKRSAGSKPSAAAQAETNTEPHAG